MSQRVRFKFSCEQLGDSVFEPAAGRRDRIPIRVVVTQPEILEVECIRDSKTAPPPRPECEDIENCGREVDQIDLLFLENLAACVAKVTHRPQAEISDA